MPELLVKRIDSAAKSGGVSRAQFIAEACRMLLDRSDLVAGLGSIGAAVGRARASDVKTENAGGGIAEVTHHAGQQTPDHGTKPDMARGERV